MWNERGGGHKSCALCEPIWPWRRRKFSARGNKRRSAEVVADNVYFGDSKRDGAPVGDYAPASGGRGSYGGAPQYGAPSGGYTAPVASSSGDFAEIDEEDGDLPF